MTWAVPSPGFPLYRKPSGRPNDSPVQGDSSLVTVLRSRQDKDVSEEAKPEQQSNMGKELPMR